MNPASVMPMAAPAASGGYYAPNGYANPAVAAAGAMDPAMAAAMAADMNVAQHFVPMFYDLVDTKRGQVHKLYHEITQLYFDGKLAEGQSQVEHFYNSVPPTVHHVRTYNGMGIAPGTTLINVIGDYEINGSMMPFFEQFVLQQLQNNSYGISTNYFCTGPVDPGMIYAPAYMPPQQFPSYQQNAASRAASTEADPRSIYVGHLDYNATEDDLRNLFGQFGPVQRVTIRRDYHTKQSKGFAYVEFSDDRVAQNALSMNGKEFMGMQLKVMQKRTNIPNYNNPGSQMDSSYRGGGRGGSRGGRTSGRSESGADGY